MARLKLFRSFASASVMAATLILVALAVAPQQLAHAQTLTVLHTFTGGSDGGEPYTGLTADQAGGFYGVTYAGGAYGQGVVFYLSHSGLGWVLSPLYTFKGGVDSGQTLSRVALGPGGVYGTTPNGGTTGNGTVFVLKPPLSICRAIVCSWSKTVVYNFSGGSDGAHPGGDLLFDGAGNIYGTAMGGGAYGEGVVYKLTRSGNSWAQTVLWSFSGGADGAGPSSGLVFDSSGNLFGTTGYGGNGWGVVYELSPSPMGWSQKTLYAFTYQDQNPYGGVAIDSAGNLFGFTGANVGAGIAYELSPPPGGWVFTLMHKFDPSYEGPFDTPTLDRQGNVYGTSAFAGGNGEVFKLARAGNGWTFTPLYDFTGGDDGLFIVGGVVRDGSGNLYGTSAAGGRQFFGTLWQLAP